MECEMQEYPRRQEFLGIPCPKCKSTSTFVEIYAIDGPEGKCWLCERRVPIPDAVLERYKRIKEANPRGVWA